MRTISLAFALVASFVSAAMLRAGPPDQRNQVLPPAPQGPTLNTALFDPTTSPVTTSVTVTQIEITQGIQDIDHSVPILAGRRTFVRVYFDATTPAGWGQVSGQLNVVGTNGSVVSVAPYSSISVLSQWNGQAQIELKRSWDGLGLLFELPAASVGVGQLTVNLATANDMYSAGAAIACTNCATLTRSVAVSATAPLRLTVIGLQYNGGSGQVAPRQIDYDLIRSWLLRAYPINAIIYNTRVAVATAAGQFDCNAANAQVALIRANDINGGTDRRTHYYGLVADNTVAAGGYFMRGCAAVPGQPTPSAIGSGPTGSSSWGWDFDGSYGDWYTGHELGHTMGRSHVGGVCGESGTDPNYPFANGQIADGTHPFVGYDIADPAFASVPRRAEPGRVSPYPATPVSIWTDVMSYCPREWLSSYTFGAIRTRLVAENAMPGLDAAQGNAPELQAGSLMHVVARLGDGWTAGTIDSLTRVSRAAGNEPAAADGPELVVRDGAGREISRTRVALFRFEDLPSVTDAAHPPGLINAAVPISAEARTITVEYAGQVIATRTGGSTAPRVSLSRAAAMGARLVAQAPTAARTLRWTGSHAEGKPLTYTVLLSGDGGATWETHAAGLARAELNVPPETLARLRAGGRRPLYRIVASDGFNSSEASGPVE